MQPVRSPGLNSSINVTPLVDVVLVLLIIFMVIAPQLNLETQVTLPQTESPPEKAENANQIVISIAADGGLFVNDTRVTRDQLVHQVTVTAETILDPQIVIKGDATLDFGRVQATMFEIEAAGFGNVGLITKQYEG
jgi:biopolymer transport protein TolR